MSSEIEFFLEERGRVGRTRDDVQSVPIPLAANGPTDSYKNKTRADGLTEREERTREQHSPLLHN